MYDVVIIFCFFVPHRNHIPIIIIRHTCNIAINQDIIPSLLKKAVLLDKIYTRCLRKEGQIARCFAYAFLIKKHITTIPYG